MVYKKAIKGQYQISLNMLKQAIEKCPDSMWNDQSFANKFWQLAFHTLFYVDMYTQGTDENFVAWEKYKENFQHLGRDSKEDPIPVQDAYSKEDVLEYYNHILKDIDARVDGTDMEAISAVSWITCTSFELQIHNIKHIHHHVGMMFDRLRNNEVDVEWGRREE